MKKFGRAAMRCVVIVLAAWIGLSLLAAVFYPRLLYHPERELAYGTPANFGAVHEELQLTTADGVTVAGWFISADPDAARGLSLLVFHGNAGNISSAVTRLELYYRLGLDTYIIDYHGYGQSGGSPSEAALYLAGEALWRHVAEERGVKAEDIVVLGYSLGGAVASRVAERNPGLRGLVLESTFTRLSDVGAALFPWLPARIILGNTYNTLERMPRLRMPLLVVHGRGDQLVPYRLGRQLHDAHTGATSFLDIADDHNLGFLIAEKRYSEGLGAFFDSLVEMPEDGRDEPEESDLF